MAILNNLIVHGSSRFLNIAQFNALKTNTIGADKGVFNKLIATDATFDSLDVEDLTAQNATVVGLLDVKGELHSNSWTNSNIATIDGSFYITPTVSCTSGTFAYNGTSITVTAASGQSFGIDSLYTSTTDGTVTTYTTWPQYSKVLLTGEVKLNGSNEWMPLGTIRGQINSSSTSSIQINNLYDSQGTTPIATLVALGSTSITNATFRNIKVSLYERASSSSSFFPMGIYMTALGAKGKTFIDIYGGGNAKGSIITENIDSGAMASPVLRIGNLSGLPKVGTITPKGWGIYTTNGFFTGTVVAQQGKIGNGATAWTIGSGSGTGSVSYIYAPTNGPTTKTANTIGMYVGTDGINNFSTSSQYVRIYDGKIYAQGADITGAIKADTGYIGGSSGWTIAAQQISSGSIGANDSMFLSTKNLAGTVAGQTLTTTAPSWRLTVGSNFGVDNTGKLYASGAEISGNIAATTGSISGSVTIGGTKTATTVLNDIVEAGTKASSYFTDITSGGVFVHKQDSNNPGPEDESSNGVLITNQINIIRGGNSVAYFGENAVIGNEINQHIEIGSDSFTAYNQDNVPFFKADYDSGVATSQQKIFVPATNMHQSSYIERVVLNKTSFTEIWSTSYILPNTIPNGTKCYLTNSAFGLYLYSNNSDFAGVFPTKQTSSSGLNRGVIVTGQKMIRIGFSNITSESYFFYMGTDKSTIFSGTVTLATDTTSTPNNKVTYRLVISGANNSNNQYVISKHLYYSLVSHKGETYPVIIQRDLDERYHYYQTITTTAPSYSLGYRTPDTTDGLFSTIIGEQLTAQGDNQVVIGKYNSNSTSSAFEIGAGTSSSRSNALSVDWSGNVNIKSGAKYKINGTALSASDVGAIPTTRTVNSKALSSDITLSASDVGAVPTTRTVNSKALSSNITLTSSDVGAVPTTRTVNSKALSSNITLTSSDVGAVPTIGGTITKTSSSPTINALVINNGTSNTLTIDWSGNTEQQGRATTRDMTTGTNSELEDFLSDLDISGSELETTQADWVVEQGTNGIWTWRKWQSGAAECWGRWTEVLTNYATYNNMNSYSSSIKTLPFSIYDAVPTYSAKVSNGYVFGCSLLHAYTSPLTEVGFYASASASGSQEILWVCDIKGRWK